METKLMVVLLPLICFLWATFLMFILPCPPQFQRDWFTMNGSEKATVFVLLFLTTPITLPIFTYRWLRGLPIQCVLICAIGLSAFGAQSPRGAETFPKLSRTRTVAPSSPPVPPGFSQAAELPLTMTIAKVAGNVAASWTGGPSNATYTLLYKTNVFQTNWLTATTTTNRTAVVPTTNRLRLMKVQSSTTAATNSITWQKGLGGPQKDTSQGVATDSNGNIYLTGWYDGQIDIGGGTLPPFGSGNIFLAKYSSSGAHLWSKGFGIGYGAATTCSGQGLAVGVDSSGNVAIAGYFAGTIDFGGGALTAAGLKDIFVAKYSDTGTFLWAKRFGSAGVESQGKSVAMDSGGNVALTGYFIGSVDFGGGTLTSANNFPDIFIAKFSASGAHQWSKRFGTTASLTETGRGITTDSGGNVLFTGTFAGNVDFGGGPLINTGSANIFIVKYSPAGAHLWSKNYGNTLTASGFSIAVDSANNVVVCGTYYGIPASVGGAVLPNAGDDDVFIAKYSGINGAHIWSKGTGSSFPERAPSITTDGSGNVIVTGAFVNMVNFGCGSITAAGSWDVFVTKYSPDGVCLWSRRYGSATALEDGWGVAADRSGGNVIVTGSFFNPVDFDGTVLTSKGNYDIFLIRSTP